MKVVAVVQARMASERLPGKVMKVLGCRAALDWTVRSAQAAHGVDDVVVATSTNSENEIIEQWCRLNKIKCFRGSEDDVLSRYIGIIDEHGADACVRLTADCPLLDARVVGEVVALFRTLGVDYAGNVDPPTWPDGLDCAVVSSEAFKFAAQEAHDPVDRDCLTQFILRNRTIFPAANLSCPLPDMVKERWVLDSPQDQKLIGKIFDAFPQYWYPNYLEIKTFLDQNPELRSINTNWWRDQRFYGSLGTQESPPKKYLHSARVLARAKKVIPHGSQTFSKSTMFFPEQNFPAFASYGDGGYLFDVDGNRYVDLVGALGPNILGYRDPDVDWAVRQQLDKGVTLSLATEAEAKLAEKLISLIPCAEMVRFGKSGSDVTGAAVKVARAYTGRDLIVKLPKAYHGWHDWTMFPDERNKGITYQSAVEVNGLPYPFDAVAGVIINPEEISEIELQNWRDMCSDYGVLLIFDEIITGFRYGLGGYPTKVVPDLACFGKAMANGWPISALVGKKKVMEVLEDPKVFWSGTFFGEAVSIAAAIATVDKIEREGVIDHIKNKAQAINLHVEDLIYTYKLEDVIKFTPDVRSRLEFDSKGTHSLFMQNMAREGVLILNSHMLCFAHKDNEVQRIVTAYTNTLRELA